MLLSKSSGSTIHCFQFKDPGQKIRNVLSSLPLSGSRLSRMMQIIQNNEMPQFSSLNLWVLENIANYRGQPPHYYLKVLVEEPGKQIKIPKTKKKKPAKFFWNKVEEKFG